MSAGVDRPLLEGLDDYDLSEDDRALLEAGPEQGGGAGPSAPLPVLAVIGRPNVGKSTLVNRVLGRREAVVQDVPGVTRDRVMYETSWSGREFVVVDTGGWESDPRGLAARVVEKIHQHPDFGLWRRLPFHEVLQLLGAC